MPTNPDNPTPTPPPPPLAPLSSVSAPPVKRSLRVVQAARRLEPFIFGALLFALISGAGREEALSLWITLNVLYALTAGVWAMFHWGPLWGTRDVSLRWAVCLTLALTLQLYSAPQGVWSNLITAPVRSSNNAFDALWFLLAGAVAGLFCLLILLSLVGASVGAFAGRRGSDIRRAAHIGVHASMMTLSVALLLPLLPDRYIPSAAFFRSLGFGFPLLARGWWRWSNSQPAFRPRFQRSFEMGWKRLLIWRIRRRGQVKVYDVRGMALGAAIASALLALPPRMIGPVQSQSYIVMRRLGTAVMSYATPLFNAPTEEQRSKYTNHRRLDLLANRHRLAILHSDEAARYDVSRRSEAAIQADMIARLQKMGVAGVVVPLPYMYGKAYPVWASEAEGAAPNADDVAHNRADVGLLADALRRAPNAILGLPSSVPLDDDRVKLLLSAARWRGDMTLDWSRTTFLPIIPAVWNARTADPPVAALACVALQNPAFLQRQTDAPARLRDYPGCARPQVDTNGVLVDFLGNGPREDFLHASYAAVRADAPLLEVGGEQSPPHWQKTSEVLRGRIVFLDSLAHPMQQTPKGAITQAEEQAYAVSTLLSGETFRRAPRWMLALLTLLIASGMGHACARSEPLDAVIRGLLLLFLILFLSVAALLNTYWLDPVVPALSVIMTLALATQLRLTRERADKQRASDMFGRFVAPQMVQTWLAQSHEELGLGGKREKLCILFADVRGFTPFTEQHDASEVIDVINDYMTALTDALHAYGGILDKYTGDGLMAFFSVAQPSTAPTPAALKASGSRSSKIAVAAAQSPSDDIALAVQCGLAMRDAASNLSVVRALAGKPTLQLGFSLHYGEVVVGLVGNIKQQVNYTALGLAVVVAARLQGVAQGGQVIVSEEVYRETADRFVFTVGEPVQVKGLTAPVRPYLVVESRQEGDGI